MITKKILGVAVFALVTAAGCAKSDHSSPRVATTAAAESGRYASVNGLEMYYEVHGSGPTLVLLHGGLCTIADCFGKTLPELAKTHRVIAIEQQGHGHTADIDRPLSYEQMADDTIALLDHVGVQNADILGYSDGATVALGVAIRRPNLVRRVVMLAGVHDPSGWEPDLLPEMSKLTADAIPAEFRAAYTRVAPRPGDYPRLVEKVKRLALDFKGFTTEDVRKVQAPVLVVQGDRDIVRPEYAVSLARLLPHAELAIMPNADHFAAIAKPAQVLSVVTPFLDAT